MRRLGGCVTRAERLVRTAIWADEGVSRLVPLKTTGHHQAGGQCRRCPRDCTMTSTPAVAHHGSISRACTLVATPGPFNGRLVLRVRLWQYAFHALGLAHAPRSSTLLA
jgi:hypothetical protein